MSQDTHNDDIHVMRSIAEELASAKNSVRRVESLISRLYQDRYVQRKPCEEGFES